MSDNAQRKLKKLQDEVARKSKYIGKLQEENLKFKRLIRELVAQCPDLD